MFKQILATFKFTKVPPDAQKTNTFLTYLASMEDRSKYCNGADMDSEGYKKTITTTMSTDIITDNMTQNEIAKAVAVAATSGTCQLAMKQNNIRVESGTVYIAPFDGWAGVSIAMCSCGPEIAVNLLRLPNVNKVVFEKMQLQSSYCTDEPTSTASGRSIYPIKPQYNHLDFLGQIFTAKECGSERVNKIFGVNDGIYELGSTVWLNEYPGQELSETLESLRYSCDKVSMGEHHCMKWKLKTTVTVSELLKLEPYASKIKSDDCVNCG